MCDLFILSVCPVGQEEMENKAMYLSTYEERESGSVYEEAYDGHNLSKLNLCDEGEPDASPPLARPRGVLVMSRFVVVFRPIAVLVCSPRDDLHPAEVASWHRDLQIYKQR